LRRLEYRGYDSAGIAVYDGENIAVCREVGKLGNLGTERGRLITVRLRYMPMPETLGIDHLCALVDARICQCFSPDLTHFEEVLPLY